MGHTQASKSVQPVMTTSRQMPPLSPLLQKRKPEVYKISNLLKAAG